MIDLLIEKRVISTYHSYQQINNPLNNDCSVCLESIIDSNNEIESTQDILELPCHHLFHRQCVTSWLNIKGNCPVCRMKLPVSEDEIIDFQN